jgi:hypothetical protein
MRGTIGGGLDNRGIALLQGQVSGPIANSGVINLTGALAPVAQLSQGSGGDAEPQRFRTQRRDARRWRHH